MSSPLRGTSFVNITELSKKDVKEIPAACQYTNLCTADIRNVRNEAINWLKEFLDRIPIWSRLKISNCLDTPRALILNKIKSYDIEIPERLISLFGHEEYQTPELNRMKDLDNFYLVSCVLTLCSALSYNVFEWSAQLLDNIIAETTRLYSEICTKNRITPKQFNMHHLNRMFKFQGINYQVTQQQVATGYLYMAYGFNEFNLARALNWFFRFYQFGIIQCCNHTLAFGYTFDNDYGFFMYDCQARGYPLFKDSRANSYILRTNHLQVLLYCMIITFNVTMEHIKFFMYNIDVRIINPLEKYNVKKEPYVPTINVQKNVESRVQGGMKNEAVKQESKSETQSATKNETKKETKNETKKENKNETKKETKNETKTIREMPASKPKIPVVNISSSKIYSLNQQRGEKENHNISSSKTYSLNQQRGEKEIHNISSSKTYSLNQQRGEKEIHNNAKTTIRSVSKIFRAISEKPPALAQKTNTCKAPLSKPTSKPNKTDLPKYTSNKSLVKISTPSNATTNNKSLTKTSKPEKSIFPFSQKIIVSPRKIPIDPNKKYYIIAVPKSTTSTFFTREPPKKDAPSTPPPTPTVSKSSTQKVSVNIHRLTTIKSEPTENVPTLKAIQKSTMELDVDLDGATPSTITLTNNNEYNNNNAKDKGDMNPLGLKVYFVDNRKKCGLIH